MWFVFLCCFLTSENGHEFLPAPALFAGGRRPRHPRLGAQRAALRSAAKDEDQDGVLQGTDEDQHPRLPRGGVCRKINGEMAVDVCLKTGYYMVLYGIIWYYMVLYGIIILMATVF